MMYLGDWPMRVEENWGFLIKICDPGIHQRMIDILRDTFDWIPKKAFLFLSNFQSHEKEKKDYIWNDLKTRIEHISLWSDSVI